MEELPIVAVDYPEATNLADLASIFQDLTFTLEACKRLLAILEQESDDPVLVQSLWTSALISYARCFATGKRFGLSESIFSHLEGEPLDVHRFYKNLRDKHVAHSVNPFEEVAIGVVLPREMSAEGEIQGVATLTMKHIAADQEGVRNLMVLARTLREEVKRLARDAEDKVLQAAKDIPIQELYEKPRLRVTAPGPGEAALPRD